MATNLEIIVGTYEEFLLGYKVEQDGDDKYSMHQSFAVHAHIGSIRSVHASGKYLASAGADDRIYVYDMKKRQEVQLLTMHKAMVNHVRFTPDSTHLFSASSDGSLAATRTGSWVSEGLWKAPHGGKSINHISLHPSGKLALTLGADLTLKTWNLVKGRQQFTTNLRSKSKLGLNIDFVEFSPNGMLFVLSGARAVEVWSVEKAGIIKTINCQAKPTALCWLDDDNLLIGLNDGNLVWSRLDNDDPPIFQMYENRVKGLHYQNNHIASISSNGDVTVWTIDIDEQNITELCAINIGCRPICLTIIDLGNFADEYILKREDTDDEETVKTNVRAATASTSNKLGKVVIEVDDNEENDDTTKLKRKETPKKPKTSKTPKTPKTPQTPKTVTKVATPATQKSQKERNHKVNNNENGVKSASKLSKKPSKPADSEMVAIAKAKRKSLPTNVPSAKKARLKRHSIANLKNNSGFIEEDI